MTEHPEPKQFAAAVDAVRALPRVSFDDCLTGARRWIERAQEEAARLGDQFYIDAFQGLLDNFDYEAADIHRTIEADNLRDQGLDEDGNPLNSDGFPITRVSFGMHHPDSPSFGGVR